MLAVVRFSFAAGGNAAHYDRAYIMGKRAEHDLKAGRSLMTLGIRLIMFSLFIALVQILLWLCQGEWTPCNMSELLRWMGAKTPASDVPGLRSILDWVLAIPLSAETAATGLAIAWIGASNAEAAPNAVNTTN